MNQEIKLTIRLPADLHRRLVDITRREHRSLNGEMVALLEQAAAQVEARLSDSPPNEAPRRRWNRPGAGRPDHLV